MFREQLYAVEGLLSRVMFQLQPKERVQVASSLQYANRLCPSGLQRKLTPKLVGDHCHPATAIPSFREPNL